MGKIIGIDLGTTNSCVAVMGERGCSYEDILRHYYPGALLAPVD